MSASRITHAGAWAAPGAITGDVQQPAHASHTLGRLTVLQVDVAHERRQRRLAEIDDDLVGVAITLDADTSFGLEPADPQRPAPGVHEDRHRVRADLRRRRAHS